MTRTLTKERLCDPKTFLGGSTPKKGRVAHARFCAFSTVTFPPLLFLSPTSERNSSRHRLKSVEKTQLKAVAIASLQLSTPESHSGEITC